MMMRGQPLNDSDLIFENPLSLSRRTTNSKDLPGKDPTGILVLNLFYIGATSLSQIA
jgi:hypothetical protein